MMTAIDERISSAAEAVLRRPLSEEERSEIHRISDAMGMRDVQSFLHLLLVFKLHEETMNAKFAELSALERKINETLESSIERLMDNGAARIGTELGDEIAEKATQALSGVKEFSVIRGVLAATSITGAIAALAYWLGASNALRIDELRGAFSGLLTLPAGWWMFFCAASYTYFWSADNWGHLKRSLMCKCLLVVQVAVMAALLMCML